MLTGDNSLIKKAGEAKEINTISKEKEQLKVEAMGSTVLTGEYVSETIKQNIVNNLGLEVLEDEFPLKATYTDTNNSYLIDFDGTVIKWDENAVARIKEQVYYTLQEAIDAVPNDNVEKEIVLLKNITENVEIKSNQNINLYLNSKTICGTSNNDYTIKTEGTVTIKGNGKVTGTTIGVCSKNSGKLRIIDGTFEGSSDGVTIENFTDLTIDGGTFKSVYPVRCWGSGNVTVNGGEFQSLGSTGTAFGVWSDINMVINGGDFSSEGSSALLVGGQANAKINKGSFNSGRTTRIEGGVVVYNGTGTLTIGNVGDNNDNILINNNNNDKVCGIRFFKDNSRIIFNSGTIIGAMGIYMDEYKSYLYINGGIIRGIGGTNDGRSGWSISLEDDGGLTKKIFLKRNSNIILSGRGMSGRDSVKYQKYIDEVD
jgi:uncharacterized protein YuzE